MTGRVADWNRQSMKKDGSKPTHGVRDMGSLFHSKAPVMLADGGSVDEAQMKQRGLDASNKEKPTGFFQRLREGSIDDPNSEAYKKYGAGRGRMEAEMDKAEAEMKVNQANARSGTIESRQAARDDADFAEADRQSSTARAVAGAPAPVEVRPVRQSRVEVQRVEVPSPRVPTASERRSTTRMSDVRTAPTTQAVRKTTDNTMSPTRANAARSMRTLTMDDGGPAIPLAVPAGGVMPSSTNSNQAKKPQPARTRYRNTQER